MANNTDEKDIFFGGEADSSAEQPAQSAPSAKEALAKQIAQNMALNDKDDDDDDLALNAQAPVQKAPAEREVYHKSYSSSSDDEYRNGNRSMSSSKKKKKKKKSHAVDIVCGIMALAIVGGVIGAYAYGKKAYDGVFLANTTINKVDVSKLTPEQAVAKLTGQIDFNDQISITKRDGSKVNIDLKDLDLTNNIGDAVDQAFKKQDHTMWFRSLLNDTSYEFDPDSSFNDTKLNAIIKRNVIESQNVIESKNAYIEQTDDGFTVVKEVVGNSIDKNKLGDIYDYISSELSKGNYDISIADLDVYEKPTIVAEDLQEQVDSLNEIATIEIKFDFVYEKATLKGTRFMDWLDFNEDGTYTVDKSEVQKYVLELAEKYNTFGTPRKFKSTNHGTVTVDPDESLYGWWLNDEEEDGMADYIIELIKDGESVTVDPIFYSMKNQDGSIAYTYEGNRDCWTAEDDIGDTYLELDLSAQHMYYYEKGKKKWECDVVTGLPTATRNTPEGVYCVWSKQSPARLKDSNADGSSWDTMVDYWNNISTCGIGIHSAPWQPYFGGDLYKWNGSHGCVNVSTEDAKWVYDNVPYNTPVVAFWS
ncbi:MAG: L,D-transpeptidase family protein [Ruminococcus sp.]|nr:L,D-transpeptidase family protein [Ruminococcus sp.]